MMMTSAQVVETSVTTTDNSPSEDYTHPDDQTTLLHIFRISTFPCWLKVLKLIFFFNSEIDSFIDEHKKAISTNSELH